MRGSMWLLALGCGLLLLTSGCCGGMHSCGGGCGYDSCSACDGGPVYGSSRPACRRSCGDDCSSCDSCGDDCGGGCCQRNFCFHPFRWVGQLFVTGYWCGPRCGGCGGCSDCCDSCDGGEGAPVASGHNATGHPGCKSCNRGQTNYDGEMSAPADGESIQDNASPEPTPAPQKSARRTTRSTPAYN